MVLKKLAPLVIALALAGGCALSSHPKIADLKYNPGRYQNHSVTVDGIVTSSWGVPLVPFKLYKVDDGTGEISVVSREGRAPRRGARVRVTGRLNEVATIGGRSIGLHLDERDREYKDRRGRDVTP